MSAALHINVMMLTDICDGVDNILKDPPPELSECNYVQINVLKRVSVLFLLLLWVSYITFEDMLPKIYIFVQCVMVLTAFPYGVDKI